MVDDVFWVYLESVRRSGEINVYGAIPLLMERFSLTWNQARKVLQDWMENYNPDDYEGLEEELM